MTGCLGIVEDLEVCASGLHPHENESFSGSGEAAVDISGSNGYIGMEPHVMKGEGALK